MDLAVCSKPRLGVLQPGNPQAITIPPLHSTAVAAAADTVATESTADKRNGDDLGEHLHVKPKLKKCLPVSSLLQRLRCAASMRETDDVTPQKWRGVSKSGIFAAVLHKVTRTDSDGLWTKTWKNKHPAS
eukprot:1944251-Amphidinium_carterae.1